MPVASLDLGSLGDVEHWMPLATPPWLARVPGPIGAFARRRRCEHDRAAPHLLAFDAALRTWARDHTDRRYRASFVLRAAIDRWAAAEVRRRKPSMVIAPSLAARHTFAAAREIGAATVLILDVPLLRALHRDLDRAAGVWPERAFLRRFRAPSSAIARQEAERVLADLIVVRGAYAHALCLADGIPESRLARLPAPPSSLPAPPRATGRVRLAGLAAARHGVDTALAAVRRLGATLVVRVGEGTEPSDLARLPGVATDDGPVDAIVCPAVCETYAAELAASAIPVIASPMAALDGRGPDPYDVEAVTDALRTATPHSPPAIEPLSPRLARLL